MATNKPGSVNQQPLYGCTSCYEECTWPAEDLRVHGSECWCGLCWDERRWGFPDQPSWNNLEPYTPALQAECEKLRKDAERLKARVAELEAAKDLLLWWAHNLSNCKPEEMYEVVRVGYSRIVNLANVLSDGSVAVKEPAHESEARIKISETFAALYSENARLHRRIRELETLEVKTAGSPLELCAAGRDGECNHPDCPQLRDNEPEATGRHCPIDKWSDPE